MNRRVFCLESKFVRLNAHLPRGRCHLPTVILQTINLIPICVSRVRLNARDLFVRLNAHQPFVRLNAPCRFSPRAFTFSNGRNRRRTVFLPFLAFPVCIFQKRGYIIILYSARWCNGSTSDSGSFSLGSSPGRAATSLSTLFLFWRKTCVFFGARSWKRSSGSGDRVQGDLVRQRRIPISYAVISRSDAVVEDAVFRRRVVLVGFRMSSGVIIRVSSRLPLLRSRTRMLCVWRSRCVSILPGMNAPCRFFSACICFAEWKK